MEHLLDYLRRRGEEMDALPTGQRVVSFETQALREIERLTAECAEHIRKRGEAGERNIVLTAERDRLRDGLWLLLESTKEPAGAMEAQFHEMNRKAAIENATRLLAVDKEGSI